MRRIRLASPGIADLPFTPGQQVRVLVGDMSLSGVLRGKFRDLLRTYSVFDFDRHVSAIDLCVLDHGDGPGTRWWRSVSLGDEVHFNNPEGKFVLQSASYHLFIGEETASVAFGAMLRSLAPEESVRGVIEVATPEDRLDLVRGDELQWIYRGDADAVGSQSLLEAVGDLDLPEQPGFAYIAGEAKACAAVRRHLVEERGWPARQSLIVKPFWTPGKRGLE
jgi:NADPH-dependent ferric siderophore reductase